MWAGDHSLIFKQRMIGPERKSIRHSISRQHIGVARSGGAVSITLRRFIHSMDVKFCFRISIDNMDMRTFDCDASQHSPMSVIVQQISIHDGRDLIQMLHLWKVQPTNHLIVLKRGAGRTARIPCFHPDQIFPRPMRTKTHISTAAAAAAATMTVISESSSDSGCSGAMIG